MLLIWFILSVFTLISESSLNKIEENRCDLFFRTKNDSLSLSIKRLTALRYTKTASCLLSDNNLVAVNQFNKIDIHLKGVQINQKKNGYQVHAKLSSYGDFIKLGNQSFLAKFSFGKDQACYQFLLPSSAFMDSKEILLSCSRILILQRDHSGLWFSVHKETDEVISIQYMNYSLNDTAGGQWFGGSLFRITSDLDDEFIYFSLNATQDLKCSFNYSITVYKSHQHYPCSIKQTPVYCWSDTLNSCCHHFARIGIFPSILKPISTLRVVEQKEQNPRCPCQEKI
ncbi:unnamed protein product [Larinioides sclopetarius]|uniref:Uncharacterized protein n=1 Tax=Larinioides sclopetarius TaxID=280406 RepID=A0AAV2A3Q2_9ARAC